MFGPYKATLAAGILAVFLCGYLNCSGEPALTVDIGQPVYYLSEQGDRFAARYGSLSDGSLHFVKVTMLGGREYTLPQVVSASGVRYTDERTLVWWTHQGTVRVDLRDEEGTWNTIHPSLREVAGAD